MEVNLAQINDIDEIAKLFDIIRSTQVLNISARSFYGSLGYIKNEEFHQYTLSL